MNLIRISKYNICRQQYVEREGIKGEKKVEGESVFVGYNYDLPKVWDPMSFISVRK